MSWMYEYAQTLMKKNQVPVIRDSQMPKECTCYPGLPPVLSKPSWDIFKPSPRLVSEAGVMSSSNISQLCYFSCLVFYLLLLQATTHSVMKECGGCVCVYLWIYVSGVGNDSLASLNSCFSGFLPGASLSYESHKHFSLPKCPDLGSGGGHQESFSLRDVWNDPWSGQTESQRRRLSSIYSCLRPGKSEGFQTPRAGDMAQGLIVLPVLAEDCSLVSSICIGWLTAACHSRLRYLTLSDPCRHSTHMHIPQIDGYIYNM